MTHPPRPDAARIPAPIATSRAGSSIGVAAGCLAVAVASLAVPATNGYDPWAWLVWGREVAHLELDTTGGPSWKPLPVLVTTLLAPSGDLAPSLWLVVSRVAGLAALVGCVALGRRLSGWTAGLVAAGLLVLTPDDDPRFLRLLLEGHTAPATAACTVWAVERHLAGRHGTSLLLLVALALDRPEAWPFLGAYGLWLGGRHLVPWWRVLAAGAVVPLLWFGGDLWGSGDLVHGAGVAQVYAEDPHRLRDALERVWQVGASPTWWLALAAVVLAVRARDRTVLALGLLVVAHLGVVVAMSAALGYAAVGRFLLPSAVLLCVLAGVGVAGVLGLVRPGWPRALVGAALVVLALPGIVPRAAALDRELARIADRERFEDEVEEALAAAGGPAVVTRCDRVAVDEDSPSRTSLAWMVEEPLHRTKRDLLDRPGVVFDRRGTPTADALVAEGPPRVEVLAATPDWLVVAVACP